MWKAESLPLEKSVIKLDLCSNSRPPKGQLHLFQDKPPLTCSAVVLCGKTDFLLCLVKLLKRGSKSVITKRKKAVEGSRQPDEKSELLFLFSFNLKWFGWCFGLFEVIANGFCNSGRRIAIPVWIRGMGHTLVYLLIG